MKKQANAINRPADSQSLLQAAFMANRASMDANATRKNEGAKASELFLQFTRSCASLEAYEGECERFTNWLGTAAGQGWAKTFGAVIGLSKSGKVKLPGTFANYISHGRRGWQMVAANLLPSLEGIESDSKLRVIIQENQDKLSELDDSSKKLTEAERADRKQARQINSDLLQSIASISERAKQLTGERVMLALPILHDAATKLLDLVQAERQADANAAEAAEALPEPGIEAVQEAV